MIRASLILIVGFIIGCICASDAVAQDSVMALRADTVVNECRGTCSTSYGSIQKMTFTVSNRRFTNGALPYPSDPTDVCSVAVSFRTRTCIIGGVKYTDIVVLGLCSTCQLHPLEILEKAILRATVPDNPIGIIDLSAPKQFFTWILPPCWTTLQCTVTSPAGSWRCAGACECSDAMSGSNTMELYCRQCCIVRIIRYIDGSCNLVTTSEYQGTRGNDCHNNHYNSTMWPLLPITGTFTCNVTVPCQMLCPELTETQIRSIPTAP